MSGISRRETLKLMALAPMASGFAWTEEEVKRAHLHSRQEQEEGGAEPYQPQFFTDSEYKTVQILSDLVLPADDRSGSASEAGVPQFIDFMMIDRPSMQTAMRGGLAWLDVQCLKRFDRTFAQSSAEQQKQLLDLIAYPEQAPADLRHGVEFFNSFRDLAASGFWTTRMGIDDLQYQGNVFVSEWKGCPQEMLDRLGVQYSDD